LRISFYVGGDLLTSFWGVDFFSVGLIFLRIWIGMLIILASFIFMEKNFFSINFLILLMLLIFLLVLTFSFRDFFMFYIRFEFRIIPTFLLVMGWGYRVERFQAGIYILIYTVMASLPFLLFLMKVNVEERTLNFFFLFFFSQDSMYHFWWIYLSLVFIVKLPVFIVHLWLPKAHVEAPLAGSMILAGVLLKLGGYGFMRAFNFCLIDMIYFRNWIMRLSLLGAIMVGFICIRQVDLKKLVAYSSVCHMGIVLCGFLSFF